MTQGVEPETAALLVEDDPAARMGAQAALESKGLRVLAADSVQMGWRLFLSHRPGIAIIDLGLPDGSGTDLCGKIRAHPELGLTPIILLTGRSTFDSKREGFDAGADQYLVKPLDPRELLLWVDALLRRVGYASEELNVLRAGECEVDLKARLVRFRGETLSNLTVKEFDLLYFLVRKQPQVLSRKYILSHLWHTVCVDQVVDTHLSNLRKKLPQALRDKLQAVPGKGLRFLP